jgi:hypothetical protein
MLAFGCLKLRNNDEKIVLVGWPGCVCVCVCVCVLLILRSFAGIQNYKKLVGQ